MTGYRLGLHGPELEFAMKKYKSHRRIPADELQHIHEQFVQKREQKIEKEKEKK